MEKKSERLEVRLGYEEKQTFTEACENQGDTPSGAVRRFINGYVRRSDEDVLSSAWRGAARRRAWKPVAFLAIFAAIAAAFIWMAKEKPFMSDEVIFSVRDFNNDGYLKGEELGDMAETLLKLMDVDASGSITPDEFISKGYMAYVMAGAKNDATQKFIPRDGEYITALKFNVTKEYVINERHEIIEKAIYLSGKVKLENLDRIVFWHDGGGVTVLNGPAGMGARVDVGDVVITP